MVPVAVHFACGLLAIRDWPLCLSAAICLTTNNERPIYMKTYGTSGLFLSYVLAMLFLTFMFGWPALVILLLVVVGYVRLLDVLNG